MRRRLTRISIHRTSWTVALIYVAVIFVIGVALAIIGTPIVAALSSLFGDEDDFSVGAWLAMSIGFAVLGAIGYGIFGYVFTALTAWVYNIIAGWTGGVEFTLSDPEE